MEEQRARLHIVVGMCALLSRRRRRPRRDRERDRDRGGDGRRRDASSSARRISRPSSIFFGRLDEARRAWRCELELAERYGLGRQLRGARAERRRLGIPRRALGRGARRRRRAGREPPRRGDRDYTDPSSSRCAPGSGSHAATRPAPTRQRARGSRSRAPRTRRRSRSAFSDPRGGRARASDDRTRPNALASELAAIGTLADAGALLAVPDAGRRRLGLSRPRS